LRLPRRERPRIAEDSHPYLMRKVELASHLAIPRDILLSYYKNLSRY